MKSYCGCRKHNNNMYTDKDTLQDNRHLDSLEIDKSSKEDCLSMPTVSIATYGKQTIGGSKSYKIGN